MSIIPHNSSNLPFTGKTAIICGGSKGIGKETAKLFVQMGGSCLVIARNEEILNQARVEIEAKITGDGQFVQSAACDTTDAEKLAPILEDFLDQHGLPDYLLNVVGYAHPEYAHKLSLDDYRSNMNANYYGQLVPTLILLPHFVEAKKGHIAFVTSVGGIMSLIGYAAYSPSKYALVGLAESLRHELKPYNINISILFPVDTDTPGFERENTTKPPETSMISDTAKLVSPDKVAEKFIAGLRKKKYEIIFGEGRLIWIIMRYAPNLLRAYLDMQLRQVRKKLGKA